MFSYLLIPMLLFILGVFGFFVVKKHVMIIMISLELLLLSVFLQFLIFGVMLDDSVGQIFGMFILTVAAAESAIGLAIVLVYFRLRNNIELKTISNLKG